jgi:superfamily II DNA/RNA helicase
MVLPYLLKANSSERFVYIKSPTGTGKTLSFVLPMLVFFEDYYLKNHL